MLKLILGLNFLSCSLFGSLFLLNTENVALWLGLTMPVILKIAGAILIFFALHLLTSIAKKTVIKGEIFYFSFGDSLWVLSSFIILMFTNLITSMHGQIATAAVAILVGTFAILQYTYATKIKSDKEQPTSEEGKRILPSS